MTWAGWSSAVDEERLTVYDVQPCQGNGRCTVEKEKREEGEDDVGKV